MNRVNVLTAMDVLWTRKNVLQEKIESLGEFPEDKQKVREILSEIMGCHEGYNILETALIKDRAKDLED